MVTIDDIREAAGEIRPFVHRTPLIYSTSFSRMSDAQVYLKAENLQKTGSFKVRGAFNKVRSVEGDSVIAASMGNHAQGVAFAAAALGKKARVVMPLTASIVKQEATKGYGAEVVLHGENFAEALEYARSQENFVFVHAYDDDAVIAGQGTLGLEILEDMDEIDYVLVPVGGGGLVSGIAVAVKSLSPQVGVIGVQAKSASSACISFAGKSISSAPVSTTIADGIAVGRVGDRPFEIMLRYVDDMISVGEDSIAKAVLLFMERKKLVVEGAGAVALAALLENRERFRGKRVLLVVSGGNIDFSLVDRIIHKGLITSDRMGVFEVIVEDLPGRLHALTGIIASHRGNILQVVHDRFAPGLPVDRARVVFTVETRGKGHLEEIMAAIREKGFEAGPAG